MPTASSLPFLFKTTKTSHSFLPATPFQTKNFLLHSSKSWTISEHATSDINSVLRYRCIVREQGFGVSLRPVYSVRERGSFVVRGRHHFQRGTYSQRSKREIVSNFQRPRIQLGFLTCLAFVSYGYIEGCLAAVRSGVSSYTDHLSIHRTEHQNCSLAVTA